MPESELRFQRRRSPVATIVPDRTVIVRTTWRRQVNHRRANVWIATGHRGESWAHTVHYVHCRLDLSESHMACHHTCMLTLRRCMAPVVLLQSKPSR